MSQIDFLNDFLKENIVEQKDDFVYICTVKNNEKINILKKVFKNKEKAYEYVINKINKHLELINEKYKNEHVNGVLPLHSQMIYTIYKQKFDVIEKYNYFLENYNEFYRCLSIDKVMFFVSKHTLK